MEEPTEETPEHDQAPIRKTRKFRVRKTPLDTSQQNQTQEIAAPTSEQKNLNLSK